MTEHIFKTLYLQEDLKEHDWLKTKAILINFVCMANIFFQFVALEKFF